MRPAAALAARLGLPVRDLELLQQALIHSSYLHEHRDLAVGHNERLEFLGDSVVSLAISDALYRRHPDDDEGVLSARRASIVSTAGLARLAGRIGLGEYLLLGEGESQRGGRRRPALLASAFEAVVGALYLDLGFDAAGAFVVGVATPELTRERPLNALKSPKSRLQEFTQRLSGERPQYRLLQAVGPDHDKVFRVEVAVEGRVVGTGEGHSRRLAEAAAAAGAIDALRREPGFFADQAKGAPELSEPAEGPTEPEDEERPEPAAAEKRLAEWEAAMREPEIRRASANPEAWSGFGTEAEAGSDGGVRTDPLR
ncbi:MAG TPA: ribonuclease III [Candidatus Limnocylindrales bacterium]|jgi:ribonuclease-3